MLDVICYIFVKRLEYYSPVAQNWTTKLYFHQILILNKCQINSTKLLKYKINYNN